MRCDGLANSGHKRIESLDVKPGMALVVTLKDTVNASNHCTEVLECQCIAFLAGTVAKGRQIYRMIFNHHRATGRGNAHRPELGAKAVAINDVAIGGDRARILQPSQLGIRIDRRIGAKGNAIPAAGQREPFHVRHAGRCIAARGVLCAR